jgi:DNA-binding transcriptional ArsR family regulator
LGKFRLGNVSLCIPFAPFLSPLAGFLKKSFLPRRHKHIDLFIMATWQDKRVSFCIKLWYNKKKGGIFVPERSLPDSHSQKNQQEIEHMPREEDFGVVADLFRLLCDKSRIRIFWLLCHREECVLSLSSLVGMSSPALSHHLRQLKGSGLVVSRREGKEVYYKAADTQTAQLLHHMIEKMVEITCPGR